MTTDARHDHRATDRQRASASLPRVDPLLGTARWRSCGNARASSGGPSRRTCCPPSWPRWTSPWPSPSPGRSPPRSPSATAATGTSGELGVAFARFAAGRLGWEPDPARMFAIPDVMTGIAEVVEAITPPGAGHRGQPAHLPAVPVPVRLLRAADHRRPAGPRPGRPVPPGPGRHRGRAGSARRSGLPAVQPAQPDRQRVVARGPGDGRRGVPAARRGAAGGRDPRTAGPARREIRAVPLARPRDHPGETPPSCSRPPRRAGTSPGSSAVVAVAGSPPARSCWRSAGRRCWPGTSACSARWRRSPKGCPGSTPLSAQLDENRALLSGLLAEHLPGVGYAAAAGELPGLAGLPGAGPWRRPGRRFPGEGQRRAQPRARTSARRGTASPG